MKYAMKYGPVDGRDGVPYKQFPQDADEVHIWYRPKDKTLLDFVQKIKDNGQVLVLSTYGIDDKVAQLIGAMCEKYGNIKLCLVEDDLDAMFNSVLLCAEYNIPFFFGEPAKNWDTLKGYVDCGVCDMFIGGKLGFDLPTVHEYLSKEDIKVRFVPNYTWRTWPAAEPIKRCFVRPEDIDLYAPFIDIMEFVAVNSNDQKMIVETYREKKRWAGNLNMLIFGLDEPINNMCLDPAFGRFRLTCKCKCGDGPDSCNICGRMYELAKTLNEKNMYYPRPKQKKEVTE